MQTTDKYALVADLGISGELAELRDLAERLSTASGQRSLLARDTVPMAQLALAGLEACLYQDICGRTDIVHGKTL